MPQLDIITVNIVVILILGFFFVIILYFIRSNNLVQKVGNFTEFLILNEIKKKISINIMSLFLFSYFQSLAQKFLIKV